VPYAERQALRAEWRDHLHALSEAYEELGSDPDTALQEALKQFGDPVKLGRQWARGWKRSIEPSVLPPMRAGFITFGLATLIWVVHVAIINGPGRSMDAGFQPLAQMSPVWAGLLGGVASRGRHALGAFYALATLIPLTLAGAGLVTQIAHTDAFNYVPLVQFIHWMPVGCAAATLGGWLRERWETSHRTWSVD
jgi:hypothetical protein